MSKTSTFDKGPEDLPDRGEGGQMVIGLQGGKRLLGEVNDGVRLFEGGNRLQDRADELETGRKTQRRGRIVDRDPANEDDLGDSGDEVEGDGYDSGFVDDGEELPQQKRGRIYRELEDEKKNGDTSGHVEFADSDSDIGSVSSASSQEFDSGDDSDEGDLDGPDDESGELKWKDDLRGQAQRLHGSKHPYRATDFSRMLYDQNFSPEEVLHRWRGGGTVTNPNDEESKTEEDNVFFQERNAKQQQQRREARLVPSYSYEQLRQKWNMSENIDALRQKFASSRAGEDEDGSDSNAGDSDEGPGDFQDLEAAEEESPVVDLELERERNARRKEELKMRFEEEDREGFLNDRSQALKGGGEVDEFGADEWYDAEKARIQRQLDINRGEFEDLDELSRARVEGYKAGNYARIVLENVPCEFSEGFDPHQPVIVGGLATTEERFGFVQIRIKRHRWHKKVLKTNDPLIFSLGWRRFQTMPIYSISDSRTRNRMLKYTPEHMHCFGTFYGPLIAPNTGFCCVQSFSNKTAGFRIAATGVVLNVDEKRRHREEAQADRRAIQDLSKHGVHQGHVSARPWKSPNLRVPRCGPCQVSVGRSSEP